MSNDNYDYLVPITPKKKYKKGVGVEIDTYTIMAVSVVFIGVFSLFFKDSLHPSMQFPSLILVVIFGGSILLPSNANKGKKLCEQFVIMWKYQFRRMVERVIKNV